MFKNFLNSNCTCGCGERGFHTADCASNANDDIITLQLDDGNVMKCVVLDIFDLDDHTYIGLLALKDENAEEGDVLIYRYSEDHNFNPVLDSIVSDEEYMRVAEFFDNWLDELEEFAEELSEDETFSTEL